LGHQLGSGAVQVQAVQGQVQASLRGPALDLVLWLFVPLLMTSRCAAF
jgi:hypothetical protein